jgi:hypothetical protein
VFFAAKQTPLPSLLSLSFPQHTHPSPPLALSLLRLHSPNRCQVESITDSTQALLLDVSEGREVPKAEAENLQKRRKLIKLE